MQWLIALAIVNCPDRQHRNSLPIQGASLFHAYLAKAAMASRPLLGTQSYVADELQIFVSEKGTDAFCCPDTVLPSSSSSSSWMVVRWARTKIVDPFFSILSRDLSTKKLSRSAALGITLGVFPVCGVTVILCATAAVAFKTYFHVPTLMLANFVATPLELGLIYPFLRIGEWISGGKHFEFTTKSLWLAISGQASKDVLCGLLHALIGWAILAPLLLGLLYLILLPLSWFLLKRYGPNSAYSKLKDNIQDKRKDEIFDNFDFKCWLMVEIS